MGTLEPGRARAMIAKRAATNRRNRDEMAAASRHRADDPLEQAKRYLRASGITVYAQSVDVPGSDLIMVGSVAMTEVEVIVKADEVRERRAAR